MTASTPTADEILARMAASLGGPVPAAARLAGEVAPEVLARHVQDSAYAMPKQGGALSGETRTLIHLAVALATGSDACVEAMTEKARSQRIDLAKLLEAFRIARFAEATRVLGSAEPLLAALAGE